jgi:hypothetical protein
LEHAGDGVYAIANFKIVRQNAETSTLQACAPQQENQGGAAHYERPRQIQSLQGVNEWAPLGKCFSRRNR